MGTVAVVAALALALPVGAGSPATQKVYKAGKLRYAVVTSVEGPGEVDANAVCPVGTRLTGGGGAMTGGNPSELDTSSMFAQDIGDADDDDDDGYFFQGHTHGFGGAVTVQAIAICLKAGQLALSYREDDAIGSMGAATLGNIHACPSGQQVVAAGLELGGSSIDNGVEVLGPDYDPVAHALTKTHSEWGAHKSPPATITIESDTICFLPVAGQLRYRVKQFAVGQEKTRTVKVDCPGKTRVVGGGFGFYPWNVLASLPFDDKDRGKAPDDGWKVRIRNIQDDDDEYATAVCMK
jgi:hypothetical protein